MTRCPYCGGTYTGPRCLDVRCLVAAQKESPMTHHPMPLEVGARDVLYARRRAAYLARERVSVVDAVAALVPEVCSAGRIWTREDWRLIEAA